MSLKQIEEMKINSSKIICISRFKKINSTDDLNHQGIKLQRYFQSTNAIKAKKVSVEQNVKAALINFSDEEAVQDLFRSHEHRALHEILLGPTRFYKPTQELIGAIRRSLFSQGCAAHSDLLIPHLPFSPYESGAKEKLLKEFSYVEVKRRLDAECAKNLTRLRNVGLDNIQYKHLLHSDQFCLALAPFFSACVRVKTVPQVWKTTYSILVDRKVRTPSNIWTRPPDSTTYYTIMLYDTIPRLFYSLLAERLLAWAEETDKISPNQRGHLLQEGPGESAFLLQQCKIEAETKDKTLVIAWLNFDNAMKNTTFYAIKRILHLCILPVEMVTLIMNLITGNKTHIRTPNTSSGYSEELIIRKGVLRGVALSEVLLQFGMEPVLREISNLNVGFEIHGKKVSHFAISNELVVISDSVHQLQYVLDRVANICESLNIMVSVSKSSVYYHHSSSDQEHYVPLRMREISLKLLESMNMKRRFFEVRQCYIFGNNRKPNISEMLLHIKILAKSKLDDYQKLKSLLAYLINRIQITLGPSPKMCQKFHEAEKKIQMVIELWLHLSLSEFELYKEKTHTPKKNEEKKRTRPTRKEKLLLAACSVYMIDHMFHQIRLKYVPFIDLFYIMKVVHGFKILNSSNKTVREIARCSLAKNFKRLKSFFVSNNERCFEQYMNGMRLKRGTSRMHRPGDLQPSQTETRDMPPDLNASGNAEDDAEFGGDEEDVDPILDRSGTTVQSEDEDDNDEPAYDKFWILIRRATIELRKKIYLSWKIDGVEIVIHVALSKNSKNKIVCRVADDEPDLEQHLKLFVVEYYKNYLLRIDKGILNANDLKRRALLLKKNSVSKEKKYN